MHNRTEFNLYCYDEPSLSFTLMFGENIIWRVRENEVNVQMQWMF